MLFDSGTDRSFVSSTFSALLDVAPSTLDTSYAVKLANGRISETNVVLRGCTLGLLDHPFDIDLMPVKLGGFDVIIGMDWLAKYHALIVCDEKVVRTPYGDEMLIIRGDNCDGGSKLNIISCTRTQKHIQKGCQVYLMQVTSKKAEDKSEEKRLEDVPIAQEFLKVFPEEFSGVPPARQVEFQIDLVPGAACVARALYRLTRAKMQELSTQFIHGFDDWVCKPYLDRFMIVFIDDILIYSKSRMEHEGLLKLINDSLKNTSSDSSSEASSDLHSDASFDSFEPYVPKKVGLGVNVEDESSEQSRSRGTDIEVVDDVEKSDRIDIDPIEAVIEACFDFADIIRASGVDVWVEDVTVAQDDVETSMRDPIIVSDDGDTPPVVPGVIPELALEGAAGIQREQGRRIVGVESAVTALTKRIAELEKDNRRLKGTLADLRHVLGSTWAIVLRYVP
ncbi:putative reverse transcriptase domain-containing protein [Tanacetum coccineum]